jgi:hypothetical protein
MTSLTSTAGYKIDFPAETLRTSRFGTAVRSDVIMPFPNFTMCPKTKLPACGATEWRLS